MVSGTVAEEGTESPIGGARVTAQTYNASAADEKDKVVIESATPTVASGEDIGHYTMYVAAGTYCFVAYAYVPNPTGNYGVAYGPGCELRGPFALGGDYTGEDLDLTGHDTGNVTGTVKTGGNDVTLSFRTEGCVPATCEQIEVLSLTVPAVPDPYTPVDYTVGLPEGKYDVVAFTDCETEDTLVAYVTADTDTTPTGDPFEFSPCPIP
jgi:hypothetical protein